MVKNSSGTINSNAMTNILKPKKSYSKHHINLQQYAT